MSNASELDRTVSSFEPIGLAEMDGVKLQSRMDTKYVFRDADLPTILDALRPDYRLLEVNGLRGSAYRSLYFDTPDRKHYLEHHNGRVFRSKVRFREYVDSGTCFLEVKRKTGRGATDKLRWTVPSIEPRLNEEQQARVAEASRCQEPLEAVLWNHFTRFTLVHRTRQERLTIDRDLRFSASGGEAELGAICVAELKESRADRGSPFADLMRSSGQRPSGLSKYCIGLLMLDMAPKYNAFKPVLLRLEHLRRADRSIHRAA